MNMLRKGGNFDAIHGIALRYDASTQIIALHILKYHLTYYANNFTRMRSVHFNHFEMYGDIKRLRKRCLKFLGIYKMGRLGLRFLLHSSAAAATSSKYQICNRNCKYRFRTSGIKSIEIVSKRQKFSLKNVR